MRLSAGRIFDGSRPRRDRGAAAVEFAILLVVLLLIIMAIIDFGRMLYVKQGVSAASREAARMAVVTSDRSWAAKGCTAAAGAQSMAAGGAVQVATSSNSAATPAYVACPASGTSAAVSPCAGNTTANATVWVKAQFQWLTPVGVWSNIANANNGMVLEDQTTMRCES
jgi:Flp pilus assembly protein TadG